jgi:hypothetical protein
MTAEPLPMLSETPTFDLADALREHRQEAETAATAYERGSVGERARAEDARQSIAAEIVREFESLRTSLHAATERAEKAEAENVHLSEITSAARRYARVERGGFTLNGESAAEKDAATVLSRALQKNQQCGWCKGWLPVHRQDCEGVRNRMFAESPEGIAASDAALAAGLARGRALEKRIAAALPPHDPPT